jgi:hypothetical protein
MIKPEDPIMENAITFSAKLEDGINGKCSTRKMI